MRLLPFHSVLAVFIVAITAETVSDNNWLSDPSIFQEDLPQDLSWNDPGGVYPADDYDVFGDDLFAQEYPSLTMDFISPTAESSTDESPTPEPLMGEPSIEEPLTANSPTADSPTAGSPTADSLIADSSTADSPTGDSPTANSPTIDSLIADSSTADSPTGDSPTANSLTADSLIADSLIADSSTADSPTADSTIVDSPTAKSSTVETSTEEPSTLDSLAVESPAAEPPIVNSPIADLSTVSSSSCLLKGIGDDQSLWRKARFRRGSGGAGSSCDANSKPSSFPEGVKNPSDNVDQGVWDEFYGTPDGGALDQGEDPSNSFPMLKDPKDPSLNCLPPFPKHLCCKQQGPMEGDYSSQMLFARMYQCAIGIDNTPCLAPYDVCCVESYQDARTISLPASLLLSDEIYVGSKCYLLALPLRRRHRRRQDL